MAVLSLAGRMRPSARADHGQRQRAGKRGGRGQPGGKRAAPQRGRGLLQGDADQPEGGEQHDQHDQQRNAADAEPCEQVGPAVQVGVALDLDGSAAKADRLRRADHHHDQQRDGEWQILR